LDGSDRLFLALLDVEQTAFTNKDMEVSTTFPSPSRRTSSCEMLHTPKGNNSRPTSQWSVNGILVPSADGRSSKEAVDDDDEADADIIVT
jgi:hypothetical protein